MPATTHQSANANRQSEIDQAIAEVEAAQRELYQRIHETDEHLRHLRSLRRQAAQLPLFPGSGLPPHDLPEFADAD
jgi:hypothetical protein